MSGCRLPGFFYAISPVLVKLYGDNPEELTAACKRHMQFYNSEPIAVLLFTVLHWRWRRSVPMEHLSAMKQSIL